MTVHFFAEIVNVVSLVIWILLGWAAWPDVKRIPCWDTARGICGMWYIAATIMVWFAFREVVLW